MLDRDPVKRAAETLAARLIDETCNGAFRRRSESVDIFTMKINATNERHLRSIEHGQPRQTHAGLEVDLFNKS